jgi:hypothetical protein
MRFLKHLAIFLFGFLVAKFWYEKKVENNRQEEIQVVLNSVKNLSKLVVSKATFSEVYNYSDSKKYFYEYVSFDKKAIVTVNASVEVGYDLGLLEIQIDSVGKKIIINKIPEATTTISPDVKYFDLQQSQFNSFTKEELNKINKKSIDKIKDMVEVTNLKKAAKTRLFEEISKVYQLSAVYGWQVVDNTNSGLSESFKN